jgi:CDP-diacylglycerol--glycerol-3-phosphate 3-phosphatidyltransferase
VVDLACSIEIALVLALLAAAYALRVALSGPARFDRVKRDQGSALFGARVMQMGYWGLDPIGRALAALGVSANVVSASSLVFGVAAGAGLAMGHFGVAAALALVSALSDALDGMVARYTGTASNSGEILDAAVDRYVEFAFLGGLVIHDRDHLPRMALALAAILGSFMVSYATAKAEAMGVPAPRGAMRRPERAMYLTLGAACCPFAALWVAQGGPSWAGELPMVAATALVAIVGNVSAVRRLASVAAAARVHEPPDVVAIASRRRGLLATFGRHQVGSVVATLIDFAIMSALVSGLGMPPALATGIGAAAGGVTNFTLGRRWIFRASRAPAGMQAWRYALVSLVSLSLNAAGEYVLHDRFGVQYLLARVIISICVSVCWNFPLQRTFVYGRGQPQATRSPALSTRATPDPR